MAIQLIALDIDGTLLDPEHKISDTVKNAVAEAKKKNVRIVLSTGRSYAGIEPLLSVLGLKEPGQICITFSGAHINHAHNGEVIYDHSLSHDDLLTFADLARAQALDLNALTSNIIFTTNPFISPYTILESHVYLSGMQLLMQKTEEIASHLMFAKFMMVGEPERVSAAIEILPRSFRSAFTVLRSAPWYYEILRANTSKGTALQRVASRLNIPQQNIMAIGDHENDIDMIVFAGTGVAMGNAIEATKHIADHITLSNAEDGVAHAINRFVLSAR